MASSVLRRITLAADQHKVILHLTPAPVPGDRPMRSGQLARWFRRHGFTDDITLSRELLNIPGTMIRYPVTELSWQDAWMHEPRDAHGRWSRTPGEAVPSAEAYPGQHQDAILREWRKAENPDVKQHLNLASAALDAGKPITAAFQLRLAGGVARKAGDAETANRLRDLAAQITGDDERKAADEAAARDLTAKAAVAVPGLLGGGKMEWNGQVDVFPPGSHDKENFHTLAFIDWNGKISMDAGEAAKIRDALAEPGKPVRDPAAFSVTLHELIHGTVGGQREEDAKAWAALNPWVQGVAEAFTELDKRNVSAGRTPTLHGLDEVYRENPTLAPHHVEWAAEQGLIKKESGSSGVYDTDTGEYRQLPPKWMLTAKARAMIPPEERYNAHQRAYQDKRNADIEEGFTELGTVHHMPEFADAVGIGGRETNILAADREGHATVAEYARRLQDPQRIEEGNAWGHYGWQTAAAQRWVRAMAKAEGKKPGGKPFQRRVVELSDEINREGAAGKVPAMVRQVMRAAKKADAYTDAGLLSDMIADTIRRKWGDLQNQRAGSEAAAEVLALAKTHGGAP